MADSVEVEFGILNITAHPHVDRDVYRSVLTKVAHIPKQFRGDEYGAITAPEAYEPGLYLGTIHVWTEIDPDKPAVNKDTLQEINVRDTAINVPENLGLNSKHFFYVLRTRDHKIFFERRNDEGLLIAPTRFKKLLDLLFAPINISGDMQVNVTVVPDEDGLNQVLSIPRLYTLDIFITAPNADSNEKSAQRILDRLNGQGAKSQEIKWTAKNRKKGLKPDEETLEEAEVAADNGMVASTGYEANGRKAKPRSTEEYAKTILYRVEGAGSALVGLLQTARNLVVRERRRLESG